MIDRIHAIIHDIIREELAKPLRSLPDFGDDAELVEDLGAGPIDIVCIFIGVEEAFNIAISDAEMENTVTVGELCALVERHLQGRQAA